MTAPPFTYYGGKTRLADRIVSLLPPHRHYVEPFAGSLAVLLAKPKSLRETVNDLDGDLVAFWRALRDQPDEFIRVCSLTPYSRAEYERSHDRADATDLERARRVWANLTQGRSGTLAQTGWRYSASITERPHGVRGDMTGYLRRMPDVARRIADVAIECLPAVDVIERYGQSEDVLIYADPPYLGDTRAGTNYQVEMPGIEQHRELAVALTTCTATVALSGYDSPLYADLYAGWHVTKLPGTAQDGGRRVEVLWSNRPLGQQASLFDEAAS